MSKRAEKGRQAGTCHNRNSGSQSIQDECQGQSFKTHFVTRLTKTAYPFHFCLDFGHLRSEFSRKPHDIAVSRSKSLSQQLPESGKSCMRLFSQDQTLLWRQITEPRHM